MPKELLLEVLQKEANYASIIMASEMDLILDYHSALSTPWMDVDVVNSSTSVAI